MEYSPKNASKESNNGLRTKLDRIGVDWLSFLDFAVKWFSRVYSI